MSFCTSHCVLSFARRETCVEFSADGSTLYQLRTCFKCIYLFMFLVAPRRKLFFFVGISSVRFAEHRRRCLSFSSSRLFGSGLSCNVFEYHDMNFDGHIAEHFYRVRQAAFDHVMHPARN